MKINDPELNIGGILRFFAIMKKDIAAINLSSNKTFINSFTLASGAKWLELPALEDQSSYQYGLEDGFNGQFFKWGVNLQTPKISSEVDSELVKILSNDVVVGILDNNLLARVFQNEYRGASFLWNASSAPSPGGLNAYSIQVSGQSLLPPFYTDISNFIV